MEELREKKQRNIVIAMMTLKIRLRIELTLSRDFSESK